MSEFTPEQIKETLSNPAGWPTLAHAALAYIEQLEARIEAADRLARWVEVDAGRGAELSRDTADAYLKYVYQTKEERG